MIPEPTELETSDIEEFGLGFARRCNLRHANHCPRDWNAQAKTRFKSVMTFFGDAIPKWQQELIDRQSVHHIMQDEFDRLTQQAASPVARINYKAPPLRLPTTSTDTDRPCCGIPTWWDRWKEWPISYPTHHTINTDTAYEDDQDNRQESILKRNSTIFRGMLQLDESKPKYWFS